MTKLKVTAEVFDEDEVLITLSGITDKDGEAVDDIEFRVQVYEDTPSLEVSIETLSDTLPSVELINAEDITLRFEAYANPFSDLDCDCCGQEDCICDRRCADDDVLGCDDGEHCDICDPCCFCDVASDTCVCTHCVHYPDIRCCTCGEVDQEF